MAQLEAGGEYRTTAAPGLPGNPQQWGYSTADRSGETPYRPSAGAGRLTLVGWIVFLFAMYLFNKTRTGHTLIYWGLVVIAIFLLVANYKRVVPILKRG